MHKIQITKEILMTKEKTRRQPRVLVSHPQNQHSLFLAEALESTNMLTGFATMLYYDKTRLPFSIVNLLPSSTRQRIDNVMARRSANLDPKHVKMSRLLGELTFVALNRLGISEQFRKNLLQRNVARYA